MTDICPIPLDKLLCELVKLRKVVAGVCNFPGLEPQPSYHLQDALKVPALLRLWVRVIVAEVALAAVELRITEVDEDCLGVPNVQEAIWLGWEASEDAAAGVSEVLRT